MVEQDDELELTDDDMYSDGELIEFEDGSFVLKREIPDYKNSIGDNYHQLVGGETLDTIAFDEYQNSKFWYKIADANNIFDPFTLQQGLGLIIPQVVQNSY